MTRAGTKLSARQEQLARDAGALSELPIALRARIGVQLVAAGSRRLTRFTRSSRR